MMQKIIILLVAVTFGCSDKESDTVEDTAVSSDTGVEEDTGEDTDDTSDTDEDEGEGEDVEIPAGPIPGPEGTDTTPEEEGFDWSDIDGEQIGNSFPQQNLAWTDYPQYGNAEILTWTDSEECVCFDAACNTCSQDDCGPDVCTYDLNENHTLTKYHIELRSTSDADHAIAFEVNISSDPPIQYADLVDVLDRLERIPVEYWYGFKIITEFGRGIQFLHGSYFNGAAAYGSMNYIDTQTVDVPILLHELGHTFEQYTRIGNPPIQEPQENILNPIWRHAIRVDDNRTTGYGSNNEWEDLAEFARIYAQCLVEGSLSELEPASPERFRIWERILLNGTTIHP